MALRGSARHRKTMQYIHKNGYMPASESRVESAMREVHENIPRNVRKTGKTGKAKEAMLRAIAFSKARRGR